MKITYLKKIVPLLLLLFAQAPSFARPSAWVAAIIRPDGNKINFTLTIKTVKGKPVWLIQNAAEKITITNIKKQGDSLIVQMPLFESQFKVKQTGNKIEGWWIKGGAIKTTILPFVAIPGTKRFPIAGTATNNISGRWAVQFAHKKNKELSVGEFRQTGNTLTGTFLNASGDYRYLEGVVSQDKLFLSGFDGVHAFLFTATIDSNNTISEGLFYSGATFKEAWTAVKDAHATVPLESVAMYIRPGEESLHFTFKNLSGAPVSITDEKYKNKVVVIQLMGSWCPNCMDETAFLSEYYNNNKQRGVEVIALAYEYSTDWERGLKTLTKFKNRYNVQYEILNTEVAVTDSLRTEKTLPELTPIKFFPSSIIIDKKGKIRKLDTGFNGPATGQHYVAYKKEFEETIEKLLKEE